MRRIIFLVWFLGLASWPLLSAPQTVQAADPQMEKVLADWQKRQNWLQAVEYQTRGTFKVPKGAYSRAPSFPTVNVRRGVNPPQDVEGPVSFTVLLDFVKGRHHRDIHEQQFNVSTGKLIPVVMKDAFNGSQMKCLVPKEENPGRQVNKTQPELTITSGNMKNGAFKPKYYPFFFAQGRVYTAMEPILPGQLRNKPDPDYLHVHGTGVHDERPCLILRTQTLRTATTVFEEYWVDTERESAIVRYVSYGGKNPEIDIGIRYRMSYDHWLPNSWNRTVFMHGKPLYRENMNVEKITINPPVTDADFEVGEIKPGMLVEEGRDLPTNHPIATPKSKFSLYRVREDGGREEIPDPAHGEGDQYKARRGHWQWVWFGLAFFVMAAIGARIWLRRRRKVRL